MAFDLSKIVVPDSIKGRIRTGTQTKVDQITRSYNALPAKYEQLIKSRGASTKLGLTGLGNYKTGDNPNTPEVETDAIYREDTRLGDRETQAVKGADNAANARGMMFSSFRDKNVGDALGRLSREANQVLTQYATDLKKLEGDKLGEQEGLYNALETLYGDEADYLKENPPPPPETPETTQPAPAGSTPAGIVRDGESFVWRGAAKPNLKSLEKKHPGMKFRVAWVSGGKSDQGHYRVFSTPK